MESRRHLVGIMGRDKYLAIILFLIFRWHRESVIHVTGLNKTKQSFLQQHVSYIPSLFVYQHCYTYYSLCWHPLPSPRPMSQHDHITFQPPRTATNPCKVHATI